MKTLAEITEALDALQATAATAVESATADSGKIEEVKSLLDGTDSAPGLKAQIDALVKERDARIQQEEFKAMGERVSTLTAEIEKAKEAPKGFFGTPASGSTDVAVVNSREEFKGLQDAEADIYGSNAERSYFADIRMANKNDVGARGRLSAGIEGLREDGKAMTEGVQAQGGYLVRPSVERQIVTTLEQDNVLRAICSKLNVNTNAIQLDQLTLSTTAGWVAELAQKPEATGMTLATVTAGVHTAAGLATISNQLLADSDPAVDQLVTADLAKRLVALEETAFLNGSGVGQPLGILQTPGINATPVTGTTAEDIALAILAAISAVETGHGAPSHILMHPQVWTKIISAKDNVGNWLLGPSANGFASITEGRTLLNGPARSLWGVPVLLSNRIPTTLNGNQTRVIVGDFREALILDRQAITVDESPHVLFTTNQTIFRAEKRVGFTAARSPLAFNIVGGAGLAL